MKDPVLGNILGITSGGTFANPSQTSRPWLLQGSRKLWIAKGMGIVVVKGVSQEHSRNNFWELPPSFLPPFGSNKGKKRMDKDR